MERVHSFALIYRNSKSKTCKVDSSGIANVESLDILQIVLTSAEDSGT